MFLRRSSTFCDLSLVSISTYIQGTLLTFIEHEHSHVRTSCALSLYEAALQWPQCLEAIVVSLQEYYLEKVRSVFPLSLPFDMQSSAGEDFWP